MSKVRWQSAPTAGGTDAHAESTRSEPSTVHAAGGPVGGGDSGGCRDSRRVPLQKPPAPAPSVEIAAPDKPVTWGIPLDNQPIATGWAPKDGVLHLYSYNEYVSSAAVESLNASSVSRFESRRSTTPTKC